MSNKLVAEHIHSTKDKLNEIYEALHTDEQYDLLELVDEALSSIDEAWMVLFDTSRDTQNAIHAIGSRHPSLL